MSIGTVNTDFVSVSSVIIRESLSKTQCIFTGREIVKYFSLKTKSLCKSEVVSYI
jgi:hypothetical protein